MQWCPTVSYGMVSRGQGEKEPQDCWKLLSGCEKTLLFLLIFALTTTVSLFIALAIFLLNSTLVCFTPDCIQSSSILLKTLDFTENPCQNFDRFLCNRYEISQHTSDTSNESSIIHTLPVTREFYENCLNAEEDTIIQELIQRIGGWPLLSGQNWDEEHFHWMKFMTKLRENGLKYDWFVNFKMVQDENGTNLLMTSPPVIETPSNNLLYYKTVVMVAVQIGSSEGIAWQRLRSVGDFEDELASISEKAKNSNETALETTVENYNLLWPEIDFIQVLNNLARGHGYFTNESLIIEQVPSFLPDLKTLLMKTPKRIQADYITWKIIESFLPYTSDNIREIYQNYTGTENRENHCLAKTQEIFSSQIETHLISQRYDQTTFSYLQEMLNFIEKQVVDGVETESLLVVGKTTQKATDMQFVTNSIIETITRIKMQNDDSFFQCLHKNTTDCQEKPEIYYDSTTRTFHLSSEYLSEDYFSKSESSFYNYARIGRIMSEVILLAENATNETTAGIAYNAYAKWYQKYGTEKKLPALEYNPKQLFWIYWGLFYCGSNSNFDVSNLSEFNNDFEC